MHLRRLKKLSWIKQDCARLHKSERRIQNWAQRECQRFSSVVNNNTDVNYHYEKAMELFYDSLHHKEKAVHAARVKRLLVFKRKYQRVLAHGLRVGSGCDEQTRKEIQQVANMFHIKRIHCVSQVLTDANLDGMGQWLATLETQQHIGEYRRTEALCQ
jgi:hypothetical protein